MDDQFDAYVCDTQIIASRAFAKQDITATYRRVQSATRDVHQMNMMMQAALRRPQLIEPREYLSNTFIPYVRCLQTFATHMKGVSYSALGKLAQRDLFDGTEQIHEHERQLAITRFSAADNLLRIKSGQLDQTLTALLAHAQLPANASFGESPIYDESLKKAFLVRIRNSPLGAYE